VVTISSIAGITGQPFVSAYAAAKFGVEGWMESLTPEVAPFGIRTMLVVDSDNHLVRFCGNQYVRFLAPEEA
jgi:short-subunit dehydrogenase